MKNVNRTLFDLTYLDYLFFHFYEKKISWLQFCERKLPPLHAQKRAADVRAQLGKTVESTIHDLFIVESNLKLDKMMCHSGKRSLKSNGKHICWCSQSV